MLADARWPAFEAVIQFKFNAVPPTDPKSGVNEGRFSRPVGELTTRELVKAILKGPFCKRRIAEGNWITASFAGHDTRGSGATRESIVRAPGIIPARWQPRLRIQRQDRGQTLRNKLQPLQEAASRVGLTEPSLRCSR